jgi:hypothetical protein
MIRRRLFLHLPLGFATLGASLILSVQGSGAALSDGAYAVEVHDLPLKVGEHGVLRVVLRPEPGHRVLKHYRNALRRLSVLDDGVRFDSDEVMGVATDEAIVFEVGVTALKPGPHPINGVMRVGYIEGDDDLSMVSLPLMARIIGIENR